MAATTRVCVYDRAGRGWSESAGTPQDGVQVERFKREFECSDALPHDYIVDVLAFGDAAVDCVGDRYERERDDQ